MAKRNGHTIFMYNQKLYIIGGNSNVTDGTNGNTKDNVYTLNLTTNAWEHLSTLGSFISSGFNPSHRYLKLLVYVYFRIV